MANKKQIIMFVFLLLGLFSFVQSIEIDPNIVNWISYYKDQKITTEVISNSTAKEIKYAVEFLGGEGYAGPFYLKIEISVESNTPSPLLCFSHDDSYCETRDILRKNPNYKNVYILNSDSWRIDNYVANGFKKKKIGEYVVLFN